jgi:ketosteroid isomerase-like protein
MSMKAGWYFAALFCVVAAAVSAQENEAESKVMALERLWGAAVQMHDIKALDSIFDDSMIYVPMDGRVMTKSQVLAETKATTPVDIVVKSSVAHLHGNIVIVTGVMQLKGTEGGKSYLRYGRFMDTWMNKGDRWVCVSSMTIRVPK